MRDQEYIFSDGILVWGFVVLAQHVIRLQSRYNYNGFCISYYFILAYNFSKA